MTQAQLDVLQKIMQEKDVYSLSKAFFQAQPTEGQQEIIQSILFPRKNRICITAFTRYGKTWSLALASALYLLLNEDVSINAIAPVQRQTKKYREYLVEFILSSPVLLEDLDVHADTVARIRKEVSQTRMTFQDGSEVRFLTAGGSNLAQSLMGHGADLVICAPYEEKIETKNKGQIPIGKIVEEKIPCKVLSFNHKKGQKEYKPVTRYYSNGVQPILNIKTTAGEFKCTPNHPVFVKNKGYLPASDLKKGHSLVMNHGTDLNIFNTKYIYNAPYQMRNMWSEILQKTQQNQKIQDTHMQHNVSWQNVFTEKQRPHRNKMQKLRENNTKNSLQVLSDRKSFLLNEVSNRILQSKWLASEQRERRDNLRRMWKGFQSYTVYFKNKAVLFDGLQKQSTFKRNEWREQPNMARWSRTYKIPRDEEIQRMDKGNILSDMPNMRGNNEGRISYTPHRPRQEQLDNRKCYSTMSELSWKGNTKSRKIQEAVVKSVEEEGRKPVYNIEVEDNNNYFLNGFLTHNCDESADISDEIFRKRITRMLGDSSDSILVEIGNPWRKNHFHDHYTSPDYKTIRISYEQGLREQRITPGFVEQQRRELTDTEFKVLYEAVFPEQTEGGLFNMTWIQQAIDARGFNGGQPVYGLDVAEAGADLNVLTKLRIKRFDGLPFYHVVWIRGWSEADTSNTVNRTLTYLEGDAEAWVNVDAIGVGKGVADQLQRKRGKTNLVKVGKTPRATSKKDRYLNQKAEYYWHLRNLFESQRIILPEGGNQHVKRLLNELEKMRYDFNARGKIEIIDPESSPDYADSLMLATAPFHERKLVFGSAPAF